MDCIIPGNNMKVLGKALQALSKIGDDLFLEARIDNLSLITLNSSKTVCARFHFHDNFFSSYEVNEEDLKSEAITCKIQMKLFLPLFKGNTDKKLDYIKLEYMNDSDFVIFKMKYKSDEILLTHKLRLMDTEVLAIGVKTDSGGNNISASAAFYNQLLAMFNVSDDEVTFEITSAKIVARNYCLGTPCRPKMMRTQTSLNSSEFLSYKIAKDTSINFSLKPFRTLINFAEGYNLNVDFNFETGGKPLSMISKHVTFEVNFIVATLDPYSDTNTSTTTVAQSRPIQLPDEDFENMDVENWDNNSSKESSFLQMMKEARNEKDVVPKSPESPRTKKTKTIFGRCYDPTFHETLLGEVLAKMSDSE